MSGKAGTCRALSASQEFGSSCRGNGSHWELSAGQGYDHTGFKKISLLLGSNRNKECILVWVPLKAENKTRTHVHMAFLPDDPKGRHEGVGTMRQERRKRQHKGGLPVLLLWTSGVQVCWGP